MADNCTGRRDCGEVLRRACLKGCLSLEMWIVIQRKITVTETAEYDNYDHAYDLLMFTCVIDCTRLMTKTAVHAPL